jgi:hypothetical protein
LRQVKKSNMDKQSLKDLTVGGILELMRNKNYFYHSAVGANYSHWTEDGTKALVEYMTIMGYKMLEAEEKELDRRAKDIVLNTLRGDTT